MPVIALEALRFHYESPVAVVFDGVDVQIDTRWRTGLVGRNGRGKTTLLRLIAGEVQPHQGRIHVPVAPVRLSPVSAGRPERTRDFVRETVAPFGAMEREMEQLLDAGDADSLSRYGEVAFEYERLGGYTIEHRIDEEWAAMDLPPSLLDQAHANLSGGERTRASIVALFLTRGGYPLIDEPTNHLDAAGRRQLGAYLERKRGFVMVSHDRALLDRCCDHFVAIERGTLRLHRGGYTSLRAQQQRELEHEERERERLSREIRDLREAARTRRTHSEAKERSKVGAYDKGFVGHRAAKLMKRALHTERQVRQRLDEKQGLVRIPEKKRLLKLQLETGPDTLLLAEHLDVGVEGRLLVKGLDLRLQRGERLAIVGPNGCGKTLLLETLLAERPAPAGTVTRKAGTRWQRSCQVPRWQEGQLADHLRDAGIDATRFRNVLGVFGVEGDVFDRPLETFSEGERKKADLARSFLEPAHVWAWDEPLNYLDIESREQIEEVLLADTPTLLFVEHDDWFTQRVATRRLALDGRGGWRLESP